ncbi:unnamed protein product, partial [Rotaria sp. Silwood1]
YEQIQHENDQLREKVNFYERHWMPKPIGSALTYFVNDEYEKKKKDKLKKISLVLNMNLDEFESFEDPKHITITCRQLVKFLYPDVNQRSTMKISSMSKEHVKAIREYARLAHPNQSQTSNFILNNAIGNVFSSERDKQKKSGSKSR